MCLDERIGRCVCVIYFSSKIDKVATPTVDEISDASFKKKRKKVYLAYLSLAGADIHVFSSLCVPCGSSVDLQCRSVRGDSRCIFITCQMQTGPIRVYISVYVLY